MEAKDTLLEIPQGTEPQTTICRLCAYRQAQAKHSFKTGIKEAIDYFFYEAGIVALLGCSTMEECKAKLPNWQAKLKEWELE